MNALFLICALALPPSSHTQPAIVSYQVMTDDEAAERLRQIYDFEEVFIHPNPQEDKLKEHGWERFPAWINRKHVWIKRRPAKDDAPKHRAMETSA